MQQQLEQVFGPPDKPLSIPSEATELIQFDPLDGAETVFGGIDAFLGWIGNFLLNEPLSAIGILALIVIVIFALPRNSERPS